MNLKQLNEEIEQFLEEYKTSKLAASSDFSGKCDIMKIDEADDNEEQLILPEQEYARAMSALETWLKSSPIWNRKKYIRKAIQTCDKKEAFAYTFKKVKSNYIIIKRKVVK